MVNIKQLETVTQVSGGIFVCVWVNPFLSYLHSPFIYLNHCIQSPLHDFKILSLNIEDELD